MPVPSAPAPLLALTPQRPDEQRAILNELFDELVGSLQLNLMTLQALPEIRAVQVGVAELQRRQPHGTGAASRRRHVPAGGQRADSRRPRPAMGTRYRGDDAGMRGRRGGNGPPRRGARTPPSSVLVPSGEGADTGAGPRRGSAPAVVLSAHRAARTGGGGSGPRRSRKVLPRRARTSGSSVPRLS